MPKKVSMDVIAKRLGLSKNTVSLALRGIPGISDQTRKLIIDTANEMGYQYKQAAGHTDTASKNLCVVIPKSARDSIGFFSFIQLGIEDEAKRNNINTILHYYEEDGNSFETPLCIKQGMISGIITLGRVSKETIQTILVYGLPLVMVDHYFDDLETDSVLTDNHCGGFMATEHLIKCGHKEIGFFGDIEVAISFYDRYQGYLKALKKFNLPSYESYSITDQVIEKFSDQDLTSLVDNIRLSKRLPSAFVCCNDVGAIKLCKALKNMGISIPDEISVIGFDDIELSRSVVPELTTMNVQKELMGKKAVQKLIARINGMEGVAEKLSLAANLVERNSVRKLSDR